MAESKLRIGFNSRLLRDGSMRGWNRYTICLIRALVESSEAEIVMFTDHPMADEHRTVLSEFLADGVVAERSSGAMPYPIWQEYWLPKAISCETVQVFHTPYHFGLPWRASCPTVATVHDAIDTSEPMSLTDLLSPRQFAGRFYLWQTRVRADRIVTVSQFSARELHEVLKIDPRRIRVVEEAADPLFHALVDADQALQVRKAYAIDDTPYVFYVGGLEERKNFTLAIDAISRCSETTSLVLVLAGGAESDRHRLRAYAARCQVGHRLRFLGRVPDTDLPFLYSGALGLVYPSTREGFGLQLVEAMAVGCPVLASSAASLPEVLGDGGVLFSPFDPTELAGFLERLENEPDWRDQLREKSRRRSLDFDWLRTALKTVTVYRDLI